MARVRIIGLKKNNAWEILKPLGFKKRSGVRWDYVRYVSTNFRIHIKRQRGGFFLHFDNH